MGFLIIFYLLVLIVAFMFTWEGSVDRYLGCSGWLCVILGFPGALLALLIKYPEEKKRKEREAAEEEKKHKQQLAEEKSILEETVVARQNVATLFERIKTDLFVDGRNVLPTRIILHYEKIQLYIDAILLKTINFDRYGIKRLPQYCSWWAIDGLSGGDPVNHLELLAKHINQSVGNVYYIKKIRSDKVSSPGSDCENHFYEQKYIEMNLKHSSFGITSDEINMDPQKIYAKHGAESRASLPTPAKSSPFKSKYITSYNEYVNTLTNLYLKGGKKQLADAEILQFIIDYDLDRRFGIRIEDVKADLSNIESTYK